jgi:Fic family protein
MRAHRPPRNPRYIWQLPDWPHLGYDAAALAAALAQVHRAQGQLMGRMAELGMAQREQATLQVLTQEVIKTSEIEGESLNLDAVRSSLARRLGLDIGALAPSDRQVDGVVDVVLDATRHFDQPLTQERLFGWHAALFPTGFSGRIRIRGGAWRNDASGPMEVVSGPAGREKVHFTAPYAKCTFSRPACPHAARTNRCLPELVRSRPRGRCPDQGRLGALVVGDAAPV